MVVYNFKKIQVVPTATDFLDIILSKLQRKTPTQIHKSLPIPRIRAFYMRKVKFAQQSFHDRLSQILDDFPKLEDLHPFYADLLNVLYDRDHYKLALGQLAHARGLVDGIARDYVRLLKYGDSLYRCKQLKRAALGRMCTLLKRHASSLGYLEQVRQHMARLPSIDPSTRTLLIAGFPNVGKSSFVNKVTRADVEVQPYAFTTKSLFVGHMDYKFLRWQVIDTPGILDHALEDRNTIEMQSITALAHLRAAVLFFIDPSETCGYSLDKQISLFKSLAPLFANKPLVLVANKVDLGWESQLSEESKAIIQSLVKNSSVALYGADATVKANVMLRMSTKDEVGIFDVRNTSCDLLLAHRVEQKVRSQRASTILNRLHMATPAPRDSKARPPSIPLSVLAARTKMSGDAEEMADAERKKTERDLENEFGGAGVYSMDWRKQYKLRESAWAYDIIPEIVDGKNIADYIDPEIEEKLMKLEEEEEAREAMAVDDGDDDEELSEGEREQLQAIHDKKKLIKKATIREKTKNRPTITKTQLGKRGRSEVEFEEHLESIGMDPESAENVAAMVRSRSNFHHNSATVRPAKRAKVSMDITEDKEEKPVPSFKNALQKKKAEKLKRIHQRSMQKLSRKGEGDRHVYDEKPKHLFSGKRSIGKTDRR